MASTEDRVLVLMPTAKDGERTSRFLAAEGLECAVCKDISDLGHEIGRGGGVAILTEEAIERDRDKYLAECLRTQPPWSDFPLVVLAHEGDGRRPNRESMNITLVERPLKIRSLVSVLHAALRSRRRQYEVRDHIEQRVRAAETIRQERERYRVTLASIGDAVIATDADGNVSFLNGVAERLTGWPQADAVGQPLSKIFRIVNERTRKLVEDPANKALREGAIVGLANHTVLIARNGTEFPIDDSAAPIRDQDSTPIGAVLVFRDVTERKRAEAIQARLAAIVESSDDAIISKSLDGIILSWNAGAERLFDFLASEAIGKPITLIIPPERLDEELEILTRLRCGKRIEHFETVRMTKGGRRLDISLTVSPMRDRDGKVVGASKVARDISDRKRAETALRDADRKKDEFIALLAHELRNPLAPIRHGLQVIKLAGNDAASTFAASEMMERQLAHMVRLIDDLLDVSRIGRNKMELRLERILMSDVIKSALETARPLIDEGKHELIVLLPQRPVYLDADLTRLAQVFSNLLTNSAKYTPQGGRIWLSAERAGEKITVSVRDTGIGIPPESLENIFDMFSQVDRSIERTTGGLGIGLALVKGIVEMHGGTVIATSKGHGMGSTFSVTLPTLAGHAEQATAVSGERKTIGPGLRILVVDDNRDGAASLSMMLKMLGNEVRTAYDGLEAIERAEDFRPEIILMDVGMPRLNGYEATKQIRGFDWGRDIVIVALTGWGQESDRELSRAAGCNGHLVKPVSLRDLECKLSEPKYT